jgi:AcrR family transcriptional regulator
MNDAVARRARTGVPGNESAAAEWTAFLTDLARDPMANGEQPKQGRSRKRQQDILHAALRVFARDGISRARLSDIAAEAEVPLSSLYEYYPSKEDIAFAVPNVRFAAFYQEYAAAAPASLSARERLRLYLRLAADFARRNRDWARTLYLEIWPSVLVSDSPARHRVDDYVRVILRLLHEGELRGEWRTDPNPYETAAILNGAVNQTIITWLIYDRPRDLVTSTDNILDRLLDALLPPIHDDAAERAPRPTLRSRPSNSPSRKRRRPGEAGGDPPSPAARSGKARLIR